jgi:hypothetical protein
MGSSSVIAGFLALNLPETRNVQLPETMEEAETMTRSSGVFRIIAKLNRSSPAGGVTNSQHTSTQTNGAVSRCNEAFSIQ